METTGQIKYVLHLQPLRQHPELTASVVYGLKWTLGTMFEDPFTVRDVLVAVREVVDNVATHCDWEHPVGPSVRVWYEETANVRQIRIATENATKDLDKAERAVALIREYERCGSATTLSREMSANLVGQSESLDGGIGLLQVASSPRCRIDVSLQDPIFKVQVEVDVSELRLPV